VAEACAQRPTELVQGTGSACKRPRTPAPTGSARNLKTLCKPMPLPSAPHKTHPQRSAPKPSGRGCFGSLPLQACSTDQPAPQPS